MADLKKLSCKNLWDSVGETPLIYIESLSKKTGCHIFGKAEFLNPGGSVKDRAAKFIIAQAEKEGLLNKGSTIVEGTAGNTGIGLAILSAERGYRCIIVMPENQAPEKFQMLSALGAQVIKTKIVPFSSSEHFYHQAREIAEKNNYFWSNQFENTANAMAHYQQTAPEIWQQIKEQTHRRMDIFICSTGTGGTIGGITRFLKEKDKNIQTILADPMGSGMYSYIKTKEIKSEGSSVTEGIGIMRVTENFKMAQIDDALQISDQEMISMLYTLAQKNGLFVGTSSALNLAAAERVAQQNAHSGKVIVTVLCDSGTRYQSRILNPDWLKEKNLKLP